ncbi:MAG: SDR family oxidoreductase [Gammaproteobacteria bacterium]
MGLLEDRANLQGRIAVVIGGGAGIGSAVTLALAGAGLDVAFCDKNGEAAPQTHAAVEKLGRRAFSQVIDALDPAQLTAFYAAVDRNFDHVDVLVNVVGGVFQRHFMDKPREECLHDIHRNYGYVLDSIRHAVPMIRRGGRGGSIVNFTTIEAHRGAAGFAVYAGAKAAITNFSRALAVELGAEKIRVNTIAPDMTPSEGNTNALPEQTRAQFATVTPEQLARMQRMVIPMCEAPSTDDLANAVLFLASDLSRFVTGTALHVDAGTWASSGFLNWPSGEGFLPAPMAPTIKKLFG